MHAEITAHLDTPVIGALYPLDGVLAWAWTELEIAAGAEVPPITDDHCPDPPLPLAKWEREGYWGWRVSSAVPLVVHESAVEIRRRPATGPMAAYSAAREHHHGLGPLKARNTTLAATHCRAVSWYAEVTDPDELHRLLAVITHLGARHRNWFGHVTEWSVTDGPEGGWQRRPLPSATGKTMRVRGPYWHSTERTTCD